MLRSALGARPGGLPSGLARELGTGARPRCSCIIARSSGSLLHSALVLRAWKRAPSLAATGHTTPQPRQPAMAAPGDRTSAESISGNSEQRACGSSRGEGRPPPLPRR